MLSFVQNIVDDPLFSMDPFSTIGYQPNSPQGQNSTASVPYDCNRVMMSHRPSFDSDIMNVYLSHAGPAFQPRASIAFSQSDMCDSNFSGGSSTLELNSPHAYASQMYTALIPPSFAVAVSQEYTYPSYNPTRSLPCSSVLGRIEVLHQNTYQRGLPTNAPLTTIAYHGFSLQCALDGKFTGLTDFHQPAWLDAAEKLDLSSKLAIVLCLPGYPTYSHQVTIFRARMQAPTRGKLASLVAREVAKFLALHEHRKPLRHPDGHYLTLEDLALVDVRHVSKGSLQPTIGIFHRDYGVSVNP